MLDRVRRRRAERNSSAHPKALEGLSVRVGLNARGVIREEDGNVYGGAVNIAARISGLSPPGEVLVSRRCGTWRERRRACRSRTGGSIR